MLIIGIVIIVLNIATILCTSLYWQHQAVVHHSALFESDSWGNSSFHWNDDSFAQMPFQDGGWEKVQTSLFQQKLKALNLN